LQTPKVVQKQTLFCWHNKGLLLLLLSRGEMEEEEES